MLLFWGCLVFKIKYVTISVIVIFKKIVLLLLLNGLEFYHLKMFFNFGNSFDLRRKMSCKSLNGLQIVCSPLC